MAIVGHFIFTKESLSEQKKTKLLMDIVDQKLQMCFKTGYSNFAGSNLMIDLY